MTSESGMFWLESAPDNKLPGHLVFADDGTPTLELHGKLTPSVQVIGHDKETGTTTMGSAEEPTDLLVHGFLENTPRHVTLIDCMTAGRNEVYFSTTTLGQHRLRVSIMVRGAHISGRDERFTGVRVRVGDIDPWASLPLIQRDNPGNGRVGISVPRVDMPPIETSEGVRLSLEEEIGASWGSVTEGRVKRSVWLQAEPHEACTLRQIDRVYVSPIVSYLNFALGFASPLTSLQVKHGDAWLGVRHRGMRSDPPERAQHGDILLPLRVAGLEVLGGFLDAYAKIGPAAPVIADLLPHGSNPNIETQVIELTTVAEGTHRRLFPDDTRMSEEEGDRMRALVAAAITGEDDRLQQIVNGSLTHLEEASYKQRLRRLAAEVATAMPGVCGKSNRWVNVVSDARNSFAHRKQTFLSEEMIDEFYAVSQSLRWVLMGTLLLQSGLSAENLRAAVQQNQQYRLFLDHMRSSLSSVYGD